MGLRRRGASRMLRVGWGVIEGGWFGLFVEGEFDLLCCRSGRGWRDEIFCFGVRSWGNVGGRLVSPCSLARSTSKVFLSLT